jgi:hypothetical protein
LHCRQVILKASPGPRGFWGTPKTLLSPVAGTVPTRPVDRRDGHSNLRTTQRYIDENPEAHARRGGLFDRGDDVRIGGTAADIATHVFADVVVVGGVTFLHARDRRDDLPGRAVTALEGVLIDEGLLHQM